MRCFPAIRESPHLFENPLLELGFRSFGAPECASRMTGLILEGRKEQIVAPLKLARSTSSRGTSEIEFNRICHPPSMEVHVRGHFERCGLDHFSISLGLHGASLGSDERPWNHPVIGGQPEIFRRGPG